MNFSPISCQGGTTGYILSSKGGETVSKGNPRINLRIDPASMSEIRMQAAAEGVSVPEFVRQIIYAWLEEHS